MTAQAEAPRRFWRDWALFIPKSVTVPLREGYSFAHFRADTMAGLTVAIVALPLAMAIAIASGATPAAGLITAVIAGFLISALGGSRFQIGGPTGAFIVVVYGVIHKFGYDGLVLATLMAGGILIVAGLLRFGTWIKYIPEPVVTGFTAGIAMIIFTSQVGDLLGLRLTNPPAEFVAKLEAFWAARESFNVWAVAVAGGALALILGLQRLAPKWPAFLLAVVLGAGAVALFHLPVETIGSRYGGVPQGLPTPHFPAVSLDRVQALLPSAFTIAFLAGVESLLSAMVADGMTGRRHRSNCELVAQGVANIGSALFGGLSATGAIARTATNIRAGARSPVAGIMHALFVLAFMAGLGPLMAYVPLASLAAVLIVVAWNMAERERFLQLIGVRNGDSVVLLATFGLTVLVDLTLAIEVGVVLAAIMFMHRMAEATAIEKGAALIERDRDDFGGDGKYDARAGLPAGVEMFELRGPLFFGAASRLADALDAAFPPPKVFILRMKEVPMADASGVGALDRFLRRCAKHDVPVIISELGERPAAVLKRAGLLNQPNVHVRESFAAALDLSRSHVQ